MINNTNKFYNKKIKPGAFAFTKLRLQYPEQVDRRMDNQICRITITDYTIDRNIRWPYLKELAKDRLWQVEVLGITDREFLVLESQLIDLKGDVVIIDEDGNRLLG